MIDLRPPGQSPPHRFWPFDPLGPYGLIAVLLFAALALTVGTLIGAAGALVPFMLARVAPW